MPTYAGGEEKAIAQSLFDYYNKVPQTAKYVKVGLDAAGRPISADCENAAQKMVAIRIDLRHENILCILFRFAPGDNQRTITIDVK